MSFEIRKIKWKGFRFIKIKEDSAGAKLDKDLVEFIKECNLAGKIVVDGGSNIGVLTVLFSREVGEGGLVYAFELQRLIFQVGCANTILNLCGNVIAFNKALSESSGNYVGHTKIDYGSKKISSVGVKTEQDLGHKEYFDRTQTIALDDLNLDNVGLIKLDLEGHEPEALNGMWRTIERNKPFLIIELSEGYLSEETINSTVEKIRQLGYYLYRDSDCNYLGKPI